MGAALGKRRSSMGPVAAFLGGLIVGGGAVGGVAALGGDETGAAPTPSASVAASAASAPSASAAPSAEPPRPTLIERASRGEEQAVKKLEAVTPRERASEQSLALADARRAAKLEQIAELKRKVELLPKYGREKPGQEQILELARDREVSTETLRMIAALPGDLGPDLLYEIWAGTRRRTETTELAEELLGTSDVRAKASKSLTIALQLRETEDCDAMAKLLEEAIEHADRRSLVPIVKLNNKRGCGEKKLDDCWQCIRKTDLLKDSVTASRSRAAP